MDDVKDKKPLGRPKKKQGVVNNEEKETINMSQKEVSKQIVQAQVGTVKEMPDVITTGDIRNRWSQVFSKYGSLGFDNIMNVWGNNRSMLNNPFIQNARVKQINSPAMKLSKEEMSDALGDPEGHEEALRSASWGLYYSNYVYNMLLQINRNTPKYLYYATPLYVDGVSPETIKSDSAKVDKILKKFNPQLTFKTVATQVAIEGKCSYLVRTSYNKKDVDFMVLQKLNSNQVKITGFGSKQQFIASFNMVIFLQPGYSVEQYPKFIQDTWQEMIGNGFIIRDKKGNLKFNPKATLPQDHILEMGANGQYMYWVQLPQDLCYTFYSDGSHPNAFCDSIGLFADLNDLGDYRWLEGALLSRGVTSVLTGEVPMIKDPKSGADQTALSPDVILGYQDFFSENVSANIFPFFGPFVNMELHSVDNQPEALDIIYSRLRDLVCTSGNSALLSLSDKPTVASTLAAENLQASRNDYLTRQFQQFLNNVINENFDLKCEWNIVLHGNIFTSLDEEKETKELVKNGVNGLIPKLLSYEGLTIEDYTGSLAYLSAMGIEIKSNSENLAEEALDNDIKVQKQELAIEEKESASVGRPKKSAGEVKNDSTSQSKNAGNNSSKLK